ncbi:ABC transporter substrate-binding protein [Aminobacter sp. HY435]|uniref:ABC transporter substrate-binding protein n=1 Tax=Aminobacter sp. HY435 TaxID=2970917 RepID=UPI0022B9533E|nr:ABC transporter substrate-binding protein [Aminobacter sp. HY435]
MRHVLKSSFVSTALVAIVLTGALPAKADALKIGATYITSGLDPAKGSNGWALTSHGVGENLFTVDKDGRLAPELAQSAERLDDLNWKIALTPDRFFSDGTPVTAETVAGGFKNTFEKNKIALATGGKLSFEALDPLTLRVTTEKPVALIQALFAEWPLVVYHLKADGAAVFTGPYEIAGFTPDAALGLKPNAHYPGADKRSEISYKRFGDAQSMALAFEAGELDLAFGLPSEVVPRLQASPDTHIKSFPVGYQYLAFINTAREHMQDVRMRQAIDLAIDRVQLAAAINGGAPATGAYAPYFPFAARDQRPTDPAKAAALLDEAGWVAGSDGKRARDGQQLKLRILAYPQRPDLVTMLPVVKADLSKLGFEVETGVVENSNEVAATGDFDMFLWAQHTAPSGDPAFFLNSMLRSGASLNHARYASPQFDAILDRFAVAGDSEKRAEIALDAQQKLFEDVPVSFLVSPDWYVGTSRRLENYQPWGSDYHVLRADIGETQ